MSEQTHEIIEASTEMPRRDFFKLAGLSAAAVALGSAGVTLAPEEAFAATTTKCYTIKTGNTTVYSNTGLTKKYGTIYSSDEITVNSIKSKYCNVTYNVTGTTKKKTGYIATSAILLKATGTSWTATSKMTTYKRPGGTTYGYVSKGDKCTVYGTSGDYVQIKYPVSGGYKIGWYKKTKEPSPVTTLQYPVKSCYVCGNNWGEYYSKRKSTGRAYHCGIDIKSSADDKNIYAACKGTVKAVGYNNANGNYVVIQHSISNKTCYSFYAHLKSYSVKKGSTVSAGSKIGIIGNTPNDGVHSTGVHLHFAFADTFKSGDYLGYVPKFTGNKTRYPDKSSGVTFYNPHYVIKNGKLPS